MDVQRQSEMQQHNSSYISTIGVHSSRGLGGRSMHKIYDVWHPTNGVEPERPFDEWIAGRWTESVGLMYSVDS